MDSIYEFSSVDPDEIGHKIGPIESFEELLKELSKVKFETDKFLMFEYLDSHLGFKIVVYFLKVQMTVVFKNITQNNLIS